MVTLKDKRIVTLGGTSGIGGSLSCELRSRKVLMSSSHPTDRNPSNEREQLSLDNRLRRAPQKLST